MAKVLETSTKAIKTIETKTTLWRRQKPVLADLKEELLERIIDDREGHLHIPCKLITAWTSDIAEKHNVKDFQASRAWLFRFLKKGNLSLERRTTTGQTMQKMLCQK